MPRYKFQVEVQPQYLSEQSDPDGGLYMFAYTITITNVGNVAAQLISRTWNVNDAEGMHEKIKGLGVVGHQPLLQPGEQFDVDIPMFVLDALSDEPGNRNLH